MSNRQTSMYKTMTKILCNSVLMNASRTFSFASASTTS